MVDNFSVGDLARLAISQQAIKVWRFLSSSEIWGKQRFAMHLFAICQFTTVGSPYEPVRHILIYS